MGFAYVIRCLIKKTNIDLALVEKVDPAIDKLRDIEDVSKNRPNFRDSKSPQKMDLWCSSTVWLLSTQTWAKN